MIEENKNVASEDVDNGKAETVKDNVNPPKVRRRGISNDTKATTRKKFQHTDAVANIGLFMGNILNVSSSFVTITSDKLPSFTGYAIPKLHLDFVSLHESASEKKYASFDMFPVESNVETIPGGSKVWSFNQAMSNIKHILDVLVFKGRAMTPEEEDMLELPFCDYSIDEFNNTVYEPVEIEEIVKGWQILFDNVVKIIETYNNGRSVTVDASGKPIEVWAKLIRYYKHKGDWKSAAGGSQEGDLAFPSFAGAGIFELVSRAKDTKQINRPSLILDITKESITPMNIVKKPTSLNSAPNMGGIGIGSGIVPPMAGDMNNNTNQFGGNFSNSSNTNEDLPF